MTDQIDDVSVEAALDALQQESNRRRDELRSIAADLPELQSRRAVLITMARDFSATADIGDLTHRLIRKLGRAPKSIWRRVTKS